MTKEIVVFIVLLFSPCHIPHTTPWRAIPYQTIPYLLSYHSGAGLAEAAVAAAASNTHQHDDHCRRHLLLAAASEIQSLRLSPLIASPGSLPANPPPM